MAPTLPARFERALTLALALLLLLLAARYAFVLPWRADDSQFVLAATWAGTMRDGGLEPIARLLPVLVAVTALVASIVALALAWIEPVQCECRRLRRALVLGTAAALYLFYLRLVLPPFAGRAVIDVFAHAAAGLGLVDLAVFLARFPEPVRLEQLEAQARSALVDPSLGTGWRAAANRRAVALLARFMPSVFGERAVELNASLAQRQLDMIGRPGFELAVVGLAIFVGLCFALAPRWPTAKHFADGLAMASMLIPVLAVTGLAANYRHGSEEARRRIGWIWLGPVLGLGVAVALFVALVLIVIAGSDAPAAQVIGLSAPALSFSAVLALWPFLTACFVLGLGISVFHGGGLDPRLAIRRGAVLTLCGLLLTAAFVAIEGAVTSQVVLRFELPDQTGAVIAGTVAAVCFAPLRRRIDRTVGSWVDRWMPVRDLAHGDPVVCSVAFVDLCGYTALSQHAQHEALLHASLLHKCARAESVRAGGRLVKTLGDAVMLRLPDPDAAVAAVRGVARAYSRGAATLELTPLPLHAGLHHGEVVEARDGDLFGAGVNLAARLLGVAAEHTLALSEAAARLLAGQPALARGPVALKNIPEPVLRYDVPLVEGAPAA